MAHLVIKDLAENVELDRKAMRAITGGKSGPRVGMPSYNSSFFQNPLEFNELKLMPGSMDKHSNRW